MDSDSRTVLTEKPPLLGETDAATGAWSEDFEDDLDSQGFGDRFTGNPVISGAASILLALSCTTAPVTQTQYTLEATRATSLTRKHPRPIKRQINARVERQLKIPPDVS